MTGDECGSVVAIREVQLDRGEREVYLEPGESWQSASDEPSVVEVKVAGREAIGDVLGDDEP